MNKEILVLRADSNDANDIARISYQVGKMHDDAVPEFYKPTGEKEHLLLISEMLKDDRNIVYKALYEGKICGFLFLNIMENAYLLYPKFGFVTNMGVDEQYRKCGIGKALMKVAEEYAREQGAEALLLEVFAFNHQAMEFYKQLSFKVHCYYMRKILDGLTVAKEKGSVKVSEIDKNDVQAVAKLYCQMMKLNKEFEMSLWKAVSEDEIFDVVIKALENTNLVKFKAVEDGKIIGFIFLMIKKRDSKGLTYPNLGYITNFVVDENYRRKGVGTRLMEAAEEYVCKQGLKVLDLDVNAFNQKAVAFYQHYGFKVVYQYMCKVLK